MMLLTRILAEGKQLPPEVNDPIVQLLKWFLGGALIVILGALIVAGAQFYSRRSSGDDGLSEAGGNVLWILGGAIVAASCTVIALAVMP
ncbi:hypothetical protein ACWIGW_44590 [Nocardia brasiliensis]